MKVRGYNVGKRVFIRLTREDIRKAKRAFKRNGTRYSTCPVSQALKKTFKVSHVGTDNGGFAHVGGKNYLLSKNALQKIVKRFDSNKEVLPCVFAIYPCVLHTA